MTTTPAGFTEAEHRGRVAALQAQMARRGLGALLLTTEPDVRYITGFLTRFFESPTRPWFVVVPATGDPVAVIPAIGAALMARTWIADIRTWPSPDPADDGIALLADTLCTLVPQGGAIGLPMGPETVVRMPMEDFFALSEAVAPRRFVDATDAVRRVREIKSAVEIDRIAAICAVAERAFARLPSVARSGLTLEAVFRRFQGLLLEEGADCVPYLAGAAGVGGYPDVISPATDTPLRQGDVLMLDTGAARAGYFCDFDRNFTVGLPDDAVRRAHAILTDAARAGAEAARPGARAADLHRAMADRIAAAGAVCAGGRLGHGLGLQLTEWPSLMPGDATPIKEGMVLTVEPAIEIAPGRLLVHEENLVVRAGGAEFLTGPSSPEPPRLD